MKKTVYSFLLGILGVIISATPAQANNTLEKVACFDTYEFGSVEVQMTSSITDVTSGSTLRINADITNENDYPLPDGQVYIKVFQKRNSEDKENFLKNGHYIVDQFIALENIHLKANETKEHTFEWKVPHALQAGDYSFASYYQVAKGFNYLGLSFTDDVIGNSLDFSITDTQAAGDIRFDKDSVTLNDKEHNFIGFLKGFERKESIEVKAPLTNTDTKAQNIVLSYALYSWDGMKETHNISTTSEAVTLEPGETKEILHTITPNDYPVNYLAITAETESGQKSIVNIRFSRNNALKSNARFNSLSLSQFPLAAGEEVTVNICAHETKSSAQIIEPLLDNNGNPVEENAPLGNNYTIEIALKDTNKKTLETYNYTGSLTGDVQGFQGTFTPEKTINATTAMMTMKDDNGYVIDEVEVMYDCENFDNCMEEEGMMGGDTQGEKNNMYLYLGIIIGGLVLILIILYMISRKGKGGRTLAALLFAVGFGVSLAGGVSASWEGGAAEFGYYEDFHEVNNVYKYATGSDVCNPDLVDDYYWGMLTDQSQQVAYRAESSVTKSNSVNKGDVFYVEDLTGGSEWDNTWNMKGEVFDTPFGVWKDNATQPEDEYFYEIYDQKGNYWRYVLEGAMSVNPPDISISTAGPVSCTPDGEKRWRCEVTESQNPSRTDEISVVVRYEETYGKVYTKHSSYDLPLSSFPSGYNPDATCEHLEIRSGASANEFTRLVNTETSQVVGKLECSGNASSAPDSSCMYKNELINFDASYENWGTSDKFCQPCDTSTNDRVKFDTREIKFTYVANTLTDNQAPLIDDLVFEGPLDRYVNEEGTYIVYGATDPEGDPIHYEVSWDNSNWNPHESLSEEDSVDIGFTHSWDTSGHMNPAARACDSSGDCSGWVNILVRVNDRPVDQDSLVLCEGDYRYTWVDPAHIVAGESKHFTVHINECSGEDVTSDPDLIWGFLNNRGGFEYTEVIGEVRAVEANEGARITIRYSYPQDTPLEDQLKEVDIWVLSPPAEQKQIVICNDQGIEQSTVVMDPGETRQFSAHIESCTGDEITNTVKWMESSPHISAPVSNKGQINAITAGETADVLVEDHDNANPAYILHPANLTINISSATTKYLTLCLDGSPAPSPVEIISGDTETFTAHFDDPTCQAASDVTQQAVWTTTALYIDVPSKGAVHGQANLVQDKPGQLVTVSYDDGVSATKIPNAELNITVKAIQKYLNICRVEGSQEYSGDFSMEFTDTKDLKAYLSLKDNVCTGDAKNTTEWSSFSSTLSLSEEIGITNIVTADETGEGIIDATYEDTVNEIIYRDTIKVTVNPKSMSCYKCVEDADSDNNAEECIHAPVAQQIAHDTCDNHDTDEINYFGESTCADSCNTGDNQVEDTFSVQETN